MANEPKNPLTLLKAVEVDGGNDVDEIGEVFRDLGGLGGRLLGLVPIVLLLRVLVKVVVFSRPGGQTLCLHQNLIKEENVVRFRNRRNFMYRRRVLYTLYGAVDFKIVPKRRAIWVGGKLLYSCTQKYQCTC